MKLINKKTGAVITVPSESFGGDWEAYSDERETEIAKTTIDPKVDTETIPDNVSETDEVNSDEEAPDDITRKDIMQELDAMGIEYKSDMKKDDLYKLMMGGQ